MIAGIWVALKGWFAWTRAAGLARRFAHWLMGDFWRIAALAAALACGVLMLRIEGLHVSFHVGPFHFRFIEIDGLRDRAERAEAALKAVKAAQSKAVAAQAAANHEPARISRAIAEASDVQAKDYYEKGRAAGAAFAAAHGVRNACPEGGANSASLPGSNSAAAQHDGPGDSAGMVAVPRADFDQLTGNALRLAQVREDAQALIASGVAVPIETEPPPDPEEPQH